MATIQYNEIGIALSFKGFKEFLSVIKNNIKSILQAKFNLKGLGNEAEKSGKKAETAAKGFSKFVRSIGRIAFYRAIRKTISEMTQAFREGVTNAYAYSNAMGGLDATNVKGNLDSLATSVLYLKNALGAALTPVIQMLTPLLVSLADKIAQVGNSISMVFSAIAKNPTYTYAKKFGTVWSDSIGTATSKAKELKRTLLGFDEINRLDAPDTSSGSGGTDTIDASKFFDEGVVTDKAKRIGEILKNAVLPVVTAIGVAFAGWKIGTDLSKVVASLSQVLGLGTTASATIGKLVGGISLIVGGLALIVYGVYDVINTGGSLKSWLAIISGIALVVTGVAIAFGGIPALITGIVLGIGALALFVVKNWDTIKAKAQEVIDNIKAKLSDLWQKILSIPIIGKIAHVLQVVIQAIVSIFSKIFEIQKKILEIFIALGKAIWGGIYNNAIKPIIDWLSGIAQWIYNNVIVKVINFFKPFVVTISNLFGDILKGVVNAVFFLIERSINNFIRLLNGAINIINTIPGVKITKVSELKLPRMANGGFVSQGQMFIANESGAEMVGSMNGHTAVANNQQIIEGIKQGVLEAMSMSSNGQNITLNVDGKQLFDIMVDRNNSMVRTSGKSPLVV